MTTAVFGFYLIIFKLDLNLNVIPFELLISYVCTLYNKWFIIIIKIRDQIFLYKFHLAFETYYKLVFKISNLAFY